MIEFHIQLLNLTFVMMDVDYVIHSRKAIRQPFATSI